MANNNNNNKTKNIDAAFDELEHSIANKNIELSKSLENWLNTSGSSSNNTSATTNTAAADAKNKIRQDYINAGGPTTAPKPETNKRYTVGASSATGSNTGSGSNGGGVSSPLTASGVGRRQNHRMTAQPPSRQVTNTSLTDSPQLSMKKAASFNPSEKGIDGIVGGKLSVGGGEGGGGDDDEWGFFKTAVPLKNQRLSSVAPEAASSSRSRSSSAARNTLPSASDNASVGSNSVNSSRHNSPHSSRRRAERKPATADDGNYHQPDNLSSSHSSSSSAADKKRPKSSVPTAKQEFDGGNQDETVPVSDYLNVNNNYSSPSSRHSSVHRQSSKKKLVVEQQQQLQPQADFVPETADDNVEEFPTSSSTPGKPISSTSRRNTLIKPQENPISRRNTLTNKATLNAATTANPAFAEALASFRESHNVRVMKKSDSNSSSVYKGVVNGANDTTIKRASQQQQHQQEEEVEQYYKMSGIDGDNNHDDGGGRETEAGDGQLKSPVIAAVDSQANQPAKRSHNSSDGGGGGASGSLNEINSFQNELEKLSRRTDVYSNSIPHQQRQQQPQLQHLQLVTIKTPSNENMLIGNDGESAVTAKERKHASMMVMGSNKSINVSSTSIAAQNQQQPLRDSSHELLQTGAAPLPLTAKERKHTSLMIATPNRSNNNNNNNRSPHISSSNMLEQQLSFNGAPGLAVPADQASSPQTPKNRRASYVLNNKGKRVVNVNASEDFPSATPEKLYEKLKDEPSAKMTPLSKSGGQSNDSLGSRGSMLDFPVAEAIKRELQMQKSSSIVADAFEPPPYTDQQLG